MPGEMSIPFSDVLVVQSDGRVDHLAGVEEHLRARGLSVRSQSEPYLCPRVHEDTRVVVVTDTIGPRCIRALRMARRIGARTMLMMDGLAEYRNTFQNPRVGDDFLRPAPVDLVCCSGLVDANTLRALGNHAAATGLPRIDAVFRTGMSEPGGGPVLVATANNPAFDGDERARLLEALRELKSVSQWSKARLIWRLTDGLDDELGVQNHPGTLWDALDDSAAVITSASTLHVEAMRAGRPTAVLHPHPTPLWQPAAWVLEMSNATSIEDTSGVTPMTRGLSRYVDSPERLLRQLTNPTREQMDRQRECLTLLDASSGEAEAAELVAEAIAELAKLDKPKCEARIRPVARLATHKPRRANRKRVVSIVPFYESPIGGVTTWSQRLAAEFESRPELGYDLQTLLVSMHQPSAHTASELLDKNTSLCVLDSTDDHYVSLANLRQSIETLEPDLVLPNYNDASYAVAMQLRYTGVPSVAIAHTDCAYYREIMSYYPDWDAAVSVSASIDDWLRPQAGRRPFDRITYGVPASETPRVVHNTGPIRIAYVGRIVQAQKQVMDLVPLAHTLAAEGVEAELHIVGDGPEAPTLRKQLRSIGSVRVVYHGPQSPDWVQSFWPTIDVAVLVSEYEGASITMLEAMGQGVVPAVTRVSSGVEDWVEDGVSGVTAAVGHPEQLAHRIVELADDRARLQRIGSTAWQRVSAALSLEKMALRYAKLFGTVLGSEVRTRPSLAGVRLEGIPSGVRYNWSNSITKDPRGERKWKFERLREAGYTSVAVGTPGPTNDAVILDAEGDTPTDEELATWYRWGVDVSWSGLVPHGGILARHINLLTTEGYERIVIYGIGRHTQRSGGFIANHSYPIVGFIDDNPKAIGSLFDLPVVKPDQALGKLRPDAVLLSSDAWEQQLWDGARLLRQAGVHIQSIYKQFEENATKRCCSDRSRGNTFVDLHEQPLG